MKKTYIYPTTEIIKLSSKDGILDVTSPTTTMTGDEATTDVNGDYDDVKANTQSYDVWNDDWSR